MKYEPLTRWLEAIEADSIPMTFAKVEKILCTPLPPSAYKDRAFWSNNSDNNVATQAWRNAGYRTTRVNMKAKTLVFERARPSELALHIQQLLVDDAEIDEAIKREIGPQPQDAEDESPAMHDWWANYRARLIIEVRAAMETL